MMGGACQSLAVSQYQVRRLRTCVLGSSDLPRTNSRGREDASPVLLQMEQSVLDRVTQQHALLRLSLYLAYILSNNKTKFATPLHLFVNNKTKYVIKHHSASFH